MDPRTRRLPGVSPVDISNWLRRDECFSEQMAYRDTLIAGKCDSVYASLPAAREAETELLDIILTECPDPISQNSVDRADGLTVEIDRDTPLLIAGRLVQEDLCLLQYDGEQYRLTAGLMCFPSSWSVTQKLGRSLASIHEPVPEFADVASIVERMLGAIRVEQPLTRANFLLYADPDLHQPRLEGDSKPLPANDPRYIRVERQTFRRLPKTLAVVFAIHTSVVSIDQLNDEEIDILRQVKPEFGL